MFMYVVSPTRAPKTKRTQTMTQASMAVRPSALGILVVMVLKMFTSTRNTVINRVILGLVMVSTDSNGVGVEDVHQHQEHRDQQGHPRVSHG